MKIRMPHTYALLFYLIIALGLASYIIPAGTYERQINVERGIEYVIPNSYRGIDQPPVSPFQFIQAISEGMMDAGDIIVFVLIVGGSFGIIHATGTINTLTSTIVKKNIGKEKRVIPMMMILLSLMSGILGTAEEALPLYPIFVTLAIALGFDSITGVAMLLLGTGSGFVAGFLNPFTTGIAQDIANLPMFSGILYRLLAYVLIVGASIIYVYRYASRVKERPELSPTYEEDQRRKSKLQVADLPSPSEKHIRVLIVLVVGVCVLVYGVLRRNFYISEISTTFLMMGILSGIVANLKSGRIASEFIKGASNLTYGALIIGLARGIMVVMEYGQIMDTIIFYLARSIEGFSAGMSAIAMLFIQSIINVFVSSGSGQAAVSMPIMTALADISGITRQTAVLAFQFGDGFSNVLSPTSGYFMAALAIGRIPWKTWAKWMLPLFAIWYVIGVVLLVGAVTISYGPF